MAEQFKALASGGVGGMSLVFVGHPLDTVKVKLQTTTGQYGGLVDCVKQTVAKDGIRGLYRGMAAPLVGVPPIFAVYWWGFEVGKELAAKIEGKESTDNISILGTMFAGGFSAIPGSAVLVPGDRIKVMLQAQDPHNLKYTGPIDCAKSIVRESGLRGLYKGTALTLLRDGPGSVAYYGAYDIMKQNLSEYYGGRSLTPLQIMLVGGIAGTLNWIVAVPADVLKSKFQMAPANRYPGGIGQVFRELVAAEGLGALYKGLGPAVARAFPANAACFLGLETTSKILNMYF